MDSVNMDLCSHLRTGKYLIEDEYIGTTQINRNNKYQYEENEKLGIKVKLSISWIGDCEYKLTFISGTCSKDKNYKFETRSVIVKITKVAENYYEQISHIEYDDLKFKNDVYLVQE